MAFLFSTRLVTLPFCYLPSYDRSQRTSRQFPKEIVSMRENINALCITIEYASLHEEYVALKTMSSVPKASSYSSFIEGFPRDESSSRPSPDGSDSVMKELAERDPSNTF